MVTIEQQLKFQNEKFVLMMKQSDEHFEKLQNNMDSRFVSVEKQFTRLYTFLTGLFFTMLAGFIPLIIKSF